MHLRAYLLYYEAVLSCAMQVRQHHGQHAHSRVHSRAHTHTHTPTHTHTHTRTHTHIHTHPHTPTDTHTQTHTHTHRHRQTHTHRHTDTQTHRHTHTHTHAHAHAHGHARLVPLAHHATQPHAPRTHSLSPVPRPPSSAAVRERRDGGLAPDAVGQAPGAGHGAVECRSRSDRPASDGGRLRRRGREQVRWRATRWPVRMAYGPSARADSHSIGTHVIGTHVTAAGFHAADRSSDGGCGRYRPELVRFGRGQGEVVKQVSLDNKVEALRSLSSDQVKAQLAAVATVNPPIHPTPPFPLPLVAAPPLCMFGVSRC